MFAPLLVRSTGSGTCGDIGGFANVALVMAIALWRIRHEDLLSSANVWMTTLCYTHDNRASYTQDIDNGARMSFVGLCRNRFF